MQSNNTSNQVPDAAPLFDADLVDLLTEVINPEDMEGLDEFLTDVAGNLLNSPDGTGVPQVQMPSTSMAMSPVATAQYNPSAQMPLMIQTNSQVASAQSLLTTQMVAMGNVVQVTSMKQMGAMGQIVQSASKTQVVSMGQMVQTASTTQSGQTGQYDPSAQPILPLLMMQSPNASVLAASQFQTGGYASGGTNQDILSENRQLHEENHKLREENQKLCEENQNVVAENQTVVAENSILKKANQNYMKKIHQLELKLKGQVCLHDEMSYIYMVVRKCLISICLS